MRPMKRTRFNEAPYIAIWETTRACDLACLHLFVSHTGEIYPSGFLPISAGNVRKDSLIDIYRSFISDTGRHDELDNAVTAADQEEIA